MAAPAVSGSVLANRVRVLGEYLETTGSAGYSDSYITDEIVLEELSNANAQVHRLYAGSDSDYRLTRYEYALSSGSDPYDLPPYSALRAVQVRPQGASTGWVTLRRADLDDDLDAEGTATDPEAYRVIGSQIELLPPPTGGTMRLSYVPAPDRLTSMAGTVYAHDATYENILVLRAVRLLKMREGYDTRDWDVRIAEAETALLHDVRRRDRAVPRKLRDPRGGPPTRRLGWRR